MSDEKNTQTQSVSHDEELTVAATRSETKETKTRSWQDKKKSDVERSGTKETKTSSSPDKKKSDVERPETKETKTRSWQDKKKSDVERSGTKETKTSSSPDKKKSDVERPETKETKTRSPPDKKKSDVPSSGPKKTSVASEETQKSEQQAEVKQDVKIKSPVGEEIVKGKKIPWYKRLSKFIYNRENGEFFQRTCKSWGQLCLFYLSLYTVLIVGVFGPCLCVLLMSMSGRYPTWYGRNSLIGNSPSIGVRPRFLEIKEEYEKLQDMDFIYLSSKSKGETGYKGYVENIRESLRKDYGRASTTCTKDNYRLYHKYEDPDLNENPCQLDLFDRDPYLGLGNCSCLGDNCKDSMFGYDDGEPCVMLRVNKILNWYPVIYPSMSTDYASVPTIFKEDWVDFISKNPEAKKNVVDACWYQRLFVRCYPKEELDVRHTCVESMLNSSFTDCGNSSDWTNQRIKLEYYPRHGMSFCYYPYTNQKNYEQPITMVKFKNIPPGIFVNFICTAYSPNLRSNTTDEKNFAGQAKIGIFKDYA